MNLHVYPAADPANAAAADCLASWLAEPGTRTFMPAAGSTPIELYRNIGRRGLNLANLTVFTLDEYLGVPLEEPRNCANLLRDCVEKGWRIPSKQFHAVSSLETDALESVRQHERKIEAAGGLDILVLGLGQNGHLGFNEPGSTEDSAARVLDLEPISIEANRKWFGGDYAPAKGVTVGMKTILTARRILILAYGPHKTAAVRAMLKGPRGPHCPASFLQTHPNTHAFLDTAAAATMKA